MSVANYASATAMNAWSIGYSCQRASGGDSGIIREMIAIDVP